MSGKRTQILVALVAAGAVFAVAAPAGAQGTKATGPQALVKVKEATPGLAAQATVSADSAQKLALAQVSKGWIKEAELENEKGALVYSYDITVAGKSGIDEVLIDAKTGALVSKSHENAAAEKKEQADEAKEAKAMKSPKAKAKVKHTAAASTTKP